MNREEENKMVDNEKIIQIVYLPDVVAICKDDDGTEFSAPVIAGLTDMGNVELFSIDSNGSLDVPVIEVCNFDRIVKLG